MRTQPKHQAPAMIVPCPITTAADPSLHIVAASNGTEAGTVRQARRGKEPTGGKGLQKKRSTERKKSIHKPKPGNKRVVIVKSAKKMPRSVAKIIRPQLVSAETADAAVNDEGMALSVSTSLPAPVAIVVDDGATDAGAIPNNDLSLDRSSVEKVSASTQLSAVARNELVPDHELFSGIPKQGFMEAFALQWSGLLRLLTQIWNWARQKLKSHQVRKRLRVCETVSLGEKRFVAVIQVDGEQFLVGGSSSSVSTLAHLERRRDFSDVFRSHCEQDMSQA